MNDGAETESHPQPAGRALSVLPILLVVAATLLVFVKIRGLGLMGYDSYPLILTARIESLADFWGTFTEKMMDGRYHGDYFRPLLNLSFAADYSLWGLEATGYQLTGALLFGATGLALWLLARRLLAGSAGWGALVCLLFFLLHDSHFEVVPVPARRPELLCALFVCVALWVQLRPRSLAQRWPLLPAVLMACAAASKETGYVMPAVACLAVFLYSRESDAKSRALHAVRAGSCHALCIGVLFAMRWFALGGLGGPAPLPPGFEGPGSLELSGTLVERLSSPQNFAGMGVGLVWLAGVLCALIVGCALFAGRNEVENDDAPRPRAAVLLSLVWISIVCLLYGISRSIEQWYLFLPVVGMSLLLGSGVEVLLGLWRRATSPARVIGGFGLVLVSVFAFFQVRYSPLYHDYPEWRAATEASDEFFEKLATRIDATEKGQHLKAPPLPTWYPPALEGPTIRGAAILDVYSVQAWAELMFPERKLRVLAQPPTTPFEPGESGIQLIRPKQF